MGAAADNTYFDDGALPFDGQDVTIGGLVFIFEDFSPEEGSHFVQSNQGAGAPRGGRDIRDVITAQCMAQFPSGATLDKTPALFTVITLVYRGVAKQFVITFVGTPQKSGQETKVSLKVRELLNSASATQPTTGNPVS